MPARVRPPSLGRRIAGRWDTRPGRSPPSEDRRAPPEARPQRRAGGAVGDRRRHGHRHGGLASAASLDDKTRALVRLGALLSLGAATVSCRSTVELARAAGATDEELVGVLLAVGPAVGAARLVTAAPMLALAIDYDVEDVDAPWPEGA